MTDDFQFQLSVSLPPSEQYAKGDMVNIRARTAEEFMSNLHGFQQHAAALCGEVAAMIRAEFAVARDAGGQVVQREQHGQQQTPPQTPQNAPQQPQGQPQGNYTGQPQGQPQNGYQSPYGAPDAQQAPPQQYGQPQQGYQGQPQQDQSGPPSSPPPHVGPPPSCSHGVKKFLAKNYNGGKPGYWMAWACPAPKGDPTQHGLEFIDTRN